QKWILNGEAKLDEVSRLVAKKVADIPEEKLVPPEPYIAVPALQAISYSMDSEELRNMYAGLLSKAINSDEKDRVHPAYVEIIRQMSPLDAKALEFIQQGGRSAVALCNIRWQKKSTPSWNGFQYIRLEGYGRYLYRNLIRAYEEGKDAIDITVSFENLDRLGLVKIWDDRQIDRESYRDFEESDMVSSFLLSTKNRPDASENEVALLPGAAEITALGRAFSRICLPKPVSK
ncbi:MAG: DUF4393 domain-containing protein, partial [Bacillota bacterium]